MTSIQRPGGPTGPSSADALAGDAATDATATSAAATPTSGAAPDAVSSLAAAVDAGTITADAAVHQLIERSVAGLPAEQAAELRAAMAELMADDPYLSGLARELGVPPEPGGGQ